MPNNDSRSLWSTRISPHSLRPLKAAGAGLELHHIDGDNANTVDKNLAVLCVSDHDAHHRPLRYTLRHTKLSASQILQYKLNWEAFVEEAQRCQPRATHIVEEVSRIGRNIRIILLTEPIAVEHCPCCKLSYSNVVDRGYALRAVASNWHRDSSATIYINPSRPSLAVLFSLKGRGIYSGALHLCRKRNLHFQCDEYEERIAVNRQQSVRFQVKSLRSLKTSSLIGNLRRSLSEQAITIIPR